MNFLRNNYFGAIVGIAVVLGVALSLAGCKEMPDSRVPSSVKIDGVIARWKFSPKYVKADTRIADGSLVIEDTSGNGNDLEINNVYKSGAKQSKEHYVDLDNYISFSNESISGNGSLSFKGGNRDGIDLVTVATAPINKMKFEDGYTIEILYYFPKSWTRNDQWMGIMARQVAKAGNVTTMDEAELGSTSVAVSSCKEVQFLTANAQDSHEMNSAAWSVSMDKGGQWYHIAIISDGEVIRTVINGAESFRNYASSEMKGLFADPEDGRFRIGSSYWLAGSQIVDKFLHGNIEEVRITKRALPQSEWLVPNPELLAGNYGSNATYKLNDKDNYNFVFIPDTQNTIKFKPEVIETAIDELIRTVGKANIKGIIHLGDVVEDDNDVKQFETAKKIFYKLPEAEIKTLIQPGNHDGFRHLTNADLYDAYFTNENDEYTGLTSSYLISDSPSKRSSYMKVKAGKYEYLIVAISHLDLANLFERAWFEKVLQDNPNLPTIVTSHDVVECSDTEPNSTKLSKKGNQIWNIAKKYNQVFMLWGGHHHGAGYSILQNNNGSIVYAVLADYQFGYNGGNGFFKYVEFSEAKNKIYIRTYSPYAASLSKTQKTFFDTNFLLGVGNDDEIDFNFSERFSGFEN